MQPDITVTLVSSTSTSLRISWSISHQASVVITQYSTGAGSWIDDQTFTNNARTAIISGLNEQTRYNVRIKVTVGNTDYFSDVYTYWTCDDGESGSPSCGPYTTIEQTFAPFPTGDTIGVGIILIEASNDSITIHWNVNFELSYVVVQIRRKLPVVKREIPADGSWFNATVVDGSVNQATVLNLDSETRYEFMLLFVMGVEYIYSDPVEYKTCAVGDTDPDCGKIVTSTIAAPPGTEAPKGVDTTTLIIAIIAGSLAVLLTVATIMYMCWRARMHKHESWQTPEYYDDENRGYDYDNTCDDESEETARVRADSTSSESDLKKEFKDR
ncbi:uncharacterized protein LOC102810114 [Saccoglossus kowalevskii]|uniref:Uncharacterized protein LOC102810114 n=1 Tax=Saccoglossus kowalevskii TaxID=10224 RepID=A0ABM0MR81_SACKO|nr:PREDICTED: uncharacterized protein LOC102810114 [Saccoglossus kowalevskii]